MGLVFVGGCGGVIFRGGDCWTLLPNSWPCVGLGFRIQGSTFRVWGLGCISSQRAEVLVATLFWSSSELYFEVLGRYSHIAVGIEVRITSFIGLLQVSQVESNITTPVLYKWLLSPVNLQVGHSHQLSIQDFRGFVEIVRPVQFFYVKGVCIPLFRGRIYVLWICTHVKGLGFIVSVFAIL